MKSQMIERDRKKSNDANEPNERVTNRAADDYQREEKKLFESVLS
jgi:hypothetical protein